MEPFEPTAPKLDEILLTAIAQLPLAWSVAAHRLLIELPEDLLIFLLRSCPTAPEYTERISDARRAAKRQLRRWRCNPALDNESNYLFGKLQGARDIVKADCRSAFEILTAKLSYRHGGTRIRLSAGFRETATFLERLSLETK